MRICIVNPGRCGGTYALYKLAKRFPNYAVQYEVITNKLPAEQDIIFKYQFLYTHQSLQGADKYIVIDRKDKEAWLYSTYMSAVNQHHHGELEHKRYVFNSVDYNHSKVGMTKVYDEVWVPERERLLAAGASMVWYEDMVFDEDVYWEGIHLVPVWSCNKQ